MSAAKLAKAALRKEIEGRIAATTVQNRESQSKIVIKKVSYLSSEIFVFTITYLSMLSLQLFGLSQFQDAKHVSIFLSLDTEVNTEPIVRKIFEDGKRCFVPR